MQSETCKESLALIGGYGKMGIWILEFLSRNGLMDRLSVTITGPREELGKKVARRFGCSYSTDNLKAVESRFIIICTPLRVTPSIIEEIAPHLRKGTIVMDICSVKSEICSAVENFLGPGTEYVSIHPMFGPSVKNLEGQVVVIVPVKGEGFLGPLQTFLAKHHARTVCTTCKMHDYALGVVQCLTHFAFIAVGTTLKDLDFDLKQSRSFSSPVYELMVDMIGRILSGDPMMYAEIQMSNPYSAKIEEIFLSNVGKLKAAVDSRNAETFSRMMIDAAKHYDDLESAFSKSGRAVSALYEELIQIKDSVGKRVAIRNEVTGAIHTGLLKEMTSDHVHIGDGKRVIRLKTANVSLLPPDEIRRKRVEKFGEHQRDASFIFDESADPEVVSKIVQTYDDELVSMCVTDVYTGRGIPKGEKSVTFHFTFFGDLDPDAADRRARGLIISLGAPER